MPLPTKKNLKDLQIIPGVGKMVSRNLWNIGIHAVSDLKGRNPEALYRKSNAFVGRKQDRCLLYVFRCAVYYSSHTKHDPALLKWWNWKDTRQNLAPNAKK